MPFEKRNHRAIERIVAIARNHMHGAADIGHREVWHELPEGGHTGIADDIALEAAHQQDRQANLLQFRCRPAHRVMKILRTSGDDPGIPVPVKPAILAPPQIAHQPVRIVRTRALRIVGGYGIDGLVQCGKPGRMGAHEGDDAADPLRLRMRDDIDEHQ